MSRAVVEIVFLVICFLAIALASVMIYLGVYDYTVFYLLGLTLISLFIYIIAKLIKKQT
jgi:hypothetical protein